MSDVRPIDTYEGKLRIAAAALLGAVPGSARAVRAGEALAELVRKHPWPTVDNQDEVIGYRAPSFRLTSDEAPDATGRLF